MASIRKPLFTPTLQASRCILRSRLQYIDAALHRRFRGRVRDDTQTLIPGGRLVFSVEHPLFTTPRYPGWRTNPDGSKVWPTPGGTNLALGVRHKALPLNVEFVVLDEALLVPCDALVRVPAVAHTPPAGALQQRYGLHRIATLADPCWPSCRSGPSS